MVVELRGSAEYAAQVIEVKHVVTYPGVLDNLVGIPVNGLTALVKDAKVGDLLMAIPAGTQLSEEFARSHNLMRDQDGYLEDNRRVRAIRLRGVPSNVLVVPAPQGVDVGTVFDTVEGKQICWKYELPKKPDTSVRKQTHEKAWKRVEDKFLPEHVDTSNWYRNVDSVPADAIFTLTQKLHGTSIRISNTLVKVKPAWKNRIAKFFGVPVADTEYAFVAGSRRVIKDVNNPNQKHFYKEDIYTREGKKYEDLIPRGFVVYGELIGWVEKGSPIQRNYTYALPDGQCELYVYRVATITPDGILTDLPWPAVKAFCHERGLNHVPELLTTASKYEAVFAAENISESRGLKFTEDAFLEGTKWVDYPVQLAATSPCDEGLVIRVDSERSIMPEFYKAKSQEFLEHESKMLDQGTEVLS